MNWLSQNLQILATLGSAIGVYLLLKQTARKDTEELKQKVDKLSEQIVNEMRDFHGRLCTLEEKYQNLKEKVNSSL